MANSEQQKGTCRWQSNPHSLKVHNARHPGTWKPIGVTQEVVTCPRCNGKGTVVVEVEDGKSN